MNPSYTQNSQLQPSPQADQSTSHKIDMLCLAILFVGFFSCLIRSDYNFAVIFFCYFVWQQRKDGLALKIIIAATSVLIAVDLIFLFTEIRVWITQDANNQIWQTIRPMHNFGIFCYALIMLLKIVLLIFAIKGVTGLNKVHASAHL